MPEVEPELARRLAHGEEVVLATVIRIGGEPPSRSGAKLLLSRHAILAGTLGCSEFDAAALADAGALLEAGSPDLRTYAHDLGTIEVHLEPHPARPLLLVGAATPVARTLLLWAPEAGFDTALVETRPARLRDQAWEAGATAGSLEELDTLLASAPPRLFVVLTDHDDPDLAAILERALRNQPEFVGLVGSRRHTGHHLEALAARGVAAAGIAGIQSPVGLDIGAVTAPEIALSILAGLVAVRRGGTGGWKRAGP